MTHRPYHNLSDSDLSAGINWFKDRQKEAAKSGDKHAYNFASNRLDEHLAEMAFRQGRR